MLSRHGTIVIDEAVILDIIPQLFNDASGWEVREI